ncbi:hypothetical protein QA641_36725 [Bradyrhizobium sp. CB1650]|uniref:hypothetical protein n=1 Tax=Bradyrhizobium sp. CB1650 TaxID=3039153 RepID=UPI002435EDE5|nr:hypothetical protein [Bradyrhizobium sp. CB1650]WGD51052.1 hypothetical protein QA641_36725 [Bradyrhizobium sp. CB1650]
MMARRYQVVRHHTQLRGAFDPVRALGPEAPAWRLFKPAAGVVGRLIVERAAIDRHVRELSRLTEDLALLDREIAQDAMDDAEVNRLMKITGVNVAVAAGTWRRSATSADSTARRRW